MPRFSVHSTHSLGLKNFVDKNTPQGTFKLLCLGLWLCAVKCPRSEFRDFCSMQRTNPGGAWVQTAVHPAIDWATWLQHLRLWWATWTDNHHPQYPQARYARHLIKATFALLYSLPPYPTISDWHVPPHLHVMWFILLWSKAQYQYCHIIHFVNPSEPDSVSPTCLCPVCVQALWQTFPEPFGYPSISVPIFLPSDTITQPALTLSTYF